LTNCWLLSRVYSAAFGDCCGSWAEVRIRSKLHSALFRLSTCPGADQGRLRPRHGEASMLPAGGSGGRKKAKPCLAVTVRLDLISALPRASDPSLIR